MAADKKLTFNPLQLRAILGDIFSPATSCKVKEALKTKREKQGTTHSQPIVLSVQIFNNLNEFFIFYSSFWKV